MAKIPKSIRIEEKLHDLLKSVGAAQGLGVEESYESALKAWTSEPVISTEFTEAGDLEPDEIRRLGILLRLMRYGNQSITAGVIALLDSQKDSLPQLKPKRRSKTA